MQAIVLVGGEGTRLRPLTDDVPKPALTLVDRPFLAYMIEWLAGHGVTEVVLACGFLPDVLREALGRRGGAGGRADPLRRRARAAGHRRGDPLRRRRLGRRAGGSLPRPQRRRAHRPRPERAPARTRGAGARRRRSACTRSRTPRPSGWSRATTAARSSSSSRRRARASRARSTPGMYVLQRSVLDLIAPGENVSIERDVFPRLVGDGLHGLLPRRLLGGHRHARALPAGELGHPRGPRGDPGRADRPGRPGRLRGARSTARRRLGRRP